MKHKRLLALAGLLLLLSLAWWLGGRDAPEPEANSGIVLQELVEALPGESDPILPERVAPETGPSIQGGNPEPQQGSEEAPPSAAPQGSKEAPPATSQEAEEETYTCTLSVRCDSLLQDLQSLEAEKRVLVPQDGSLFHAAEITFSEGESVFDLLWREMKGAGIHLAFRDTPLYDSVYVEGIGNLYEFDAGPLSGWMYRVNGSFPGYGCSQYILKDGDVVEWLYSLDLGRDLGGGMAGE